MQLRIQGTHRIDLFRGLGTLYFRFLVKPEVKDHTALCCQCLSHVFRQMSMGRRAPLSQHGRRQHPIDQRHISLGVFP